MARNIKIELELPEFEKELNVSITLRRDGEVTTVTSSPAIGVLTEQGSGGAWKQHVVDDTSRKIESLNVPGAVGETPAMSETAKSKRTKKTSSSAGNMMDMNF
jgi:hypothetical protein